MYTKPQSLRPILQKKCLTYHDAYAIMYLTKKFSLEIKRALPLVSRQIFL